MGHSGSPADTELSCKIRGSPEAQGPRKRSNVPDFIKQVKESSGDKLIKRLDFKGRKAQLLRFFAKSMKLF